MLWRRATARNVSFKTLYGGQFTLSTQLIILNCTILTVWFTVIKTLEGGFFTYSAMKSGQLPYKAHFLNNNLFHFLENTSLYFITFGCIIFRSVKPWSAISLNNSVWMAYRMLNFLMSVKQSRCDFNYFFTLSTQLIILNYKLVNLQGSHGIRLLKTFLMC